MKHHDFKAEYLAERQGYVCAIFRGCSKHPETRPPTRLHFDIEALVAQVTEIHHYRCHNTKANRRRYPLLVDSLLNLCAVNHAWHMANPFWGRVSLLDADRIESFLRRHPRWCAWLNGETDDLFGMRVEIDSSMPDGEAEIRVPGKRPVRVVNIGTDRMGVEE